MRSYCTYKHIMNKEYLSSLISLATWIYYGFLARYFSWVWVVSFESLYFSILRSRLSSLSCFSFSEYSIPNYVSFCFYTGSFLLQSNNEQCHLNHKLLRDNYSISPYCSYLCSLCMFQHLFEFLILFIIWFSTRESSCSGHKIWRQLSDCCTDTLCEKPKYSYEILFSTIVTRNTSNLYFSISSKTC